MDERSGGQYWTPQRLRAAQFYQAGVYVYARGLIAQDHAVQTVIDVGCGPALKLARIAQAYPERRYVGIDQGSAIAYCQAQHGFGLWLEDDFDAPRRDGTVPAGDLLICADVIEHVERPDTLLTYLRSIAKPGARTVLSTPDRARLAGPDARQPENPVHVHEWTADEFRQYLESRGVEVLDQRHSPALAPAFDRIFLYQLLRQWSRLKRLTYNQLCLVRFPE